MLKQAMSLKIIPQVRSQDAGFIKTSLLGYTWLGWVFSSGKIYFYFWVLEVAVFTAMNHSGGLVIFDSL